MDIKEIIVPARDPKEIIETLKQKSVVVPPWSNIEKEYEPTKHAVVADAWLAEQQTQSRYGFRRSFIIFLILFHNI